MSDNLNRIDKKILVIDDDDLVRRSVEKLLTHTGYDVTIAHDFESAIKVIRSKEVDLVISDIRMPGKNGVETVREIRRLVCEYTKRDLPIIFITGYAESIDELKAEILGEVILKPFDLEHLLTTVREYL